MSYEHIDPSEAPTEEFEPVYPVKHNHPVKEFLFILKTALTSPFLLLSEWGHEARADLKGEAVKGWGDYRKNTAI